MGKWAENIQLVMTGEAVPGPWMDFFLRAISRIYALAVRIRNLLYDAGVVKPKKLSCPVVSVGNLTVGGTGKTPMTLWLADMLQKSGFRPVVISRGYRGRAEKTGGIVSNMEEVLATPEMAGDEAYLMATKLKGIPVLVGADRFQSGMTALHKFLPDVVILDDGFQHRRLARDLDMILVDGAVLFGNGHLLPRGILREPMPALDRADFLIMTRCGAQAMEAAETLSGLVPGKPVFRSAHVPYVSQWVKGGAAAGETLPMHAGLEGNQLPSARVLAFSGIAKNREFFRTVERIGGSVVSTISFDDHHDYADDDFKRILAAARECGADFLATTEKDFVKIKERFRLPMDLWVIGIRMDFGADEARVCRWVKDAIRRKSAG